MIEIVNVDCAEHLRALPENSLESCVTDPPYGLSQHTEELIREVLAAWIRNEPFNPKGLRGFMGKHWDGFVPGPEVWREVYRVLKPGGYCLVFAGTRSADLMAVALRLAGFEIRDSIHAGGWSCDTLGWVYGSGFPKSLDISKALDKMVGAEREVVGPNPNRAGRKPESYSDGWNRPWQSDPNAAAQMITAPATDAARTWEGWGTALKPAWEPVIVARKPVEGTVAENVVKYGTGGINVDGCRVHSGGSQGGSTSGSTALGQGSGWNAHNNRPTEIDRSMAAGRWPPNLLLTHHSECQSQENGGACVASCPVSVMDGQSGILKSGDKLPHHQRHVARLGHGGTYGQDAGSDSAFGGKTFAGDSGGASRFFPNFQLTEADLAPFLYCAKASRSERETGCDDLPARSSAETVDREEDSAGLQSPRTGAGRMASSVRNHHATVKPVALMRWLVRLVTPPGGTVLDPFTGSGTTGVAAVQEGFNFLGLEREADYCAIARARVQHAAGVPVAQVAPPSEVQKEEEEKPEVVKPAGLSSFLARLRFS